MLLDKWEPVTYNFDKDLNEVLFTLHHGAQFIAMTGRYLAAPYPDDSHTSMQYEVRRGMLAGNSLPNGIRVALGMQDLSLNLIGDPNRPIREILLAHKTKQQVFEELSLELAATGLNTAPLSMGLHYEIPAHPLDDGASFSYTNKELFRENTILRHNADLILNEVISGMKGAEPVRVWPHHFDTGTLIPLTYHNGELTKSLGLGWAIPDSLSNEPYFYISFWEREGSGLEGELPPLDAGSWITSRWNGGILRLSELIRSTNPQDQKRMAQSFFNSGIRILTNFLR